MEKKEMFKEFVKKNPSLVKYVKNGEMTFQKFYEIYDIYGEEEEAWKDYLKKEEAVAAAATTVGLAESFKWLKNIDLNSIQEGVNSIQRVLGVLSDVTKKDSVESPKEEYKARPLYKHFED